MSLSQPVGSGRDQRSSTTTAPRAGLDVDGRRAIARGFVSGLLVLLVLLGVSGRADWLEAYLLVGLLMLFHLIHVVVLLRLDPALLNRRGRVVRDGTAPWDPWVLALWRLSAFSCYAVAALDMRSSWSALPASSPILGIVLYGLAAGLVIPAMVVNAHFEPTVRVQHDRAHSVCSDGPYRFVRHPGYLGALLLAIADPLILGSGWAMAPAVLVVAALLLRTWLEDRLLLRELAGYSGYAARIRYRLLPYIW